jgi:hypothetical protein
MRPGGDTVGVGAAGVAAKEIEKTVKLALRMMKTAGAGPAIRAAINRRIALLAFNPGEFIGHQRQRLLPAHFDKGFTPAPSRLAAPLSETLPAPPGDERVMSPAPRPATTAQSVTGCCPTQPG